VHQYQPCDALRVGRGERQGQEATKAVPDQVNWRFHVKAVQQSRKVAHQLGEAIASVGSLREPVPTQVIEQHTHVLGEGGSEGKVEAREVVEHQTVYEHGADGLVPEDLVVAAQAAKGEVSHA